MTALSTAAAAEYGGIVNTVELAYENILKLSVIEQFDYREEKIKTWLRIVNERITYFSELLTRDNGQVSERRSISAKIAQLHSYRMKIAKCSVENPVFGGALDEPAENVGDVGEENQLQWQDMDNAFYNSIKTGSVVNIRHKSVNAFMTDAKQTIVENIARTMNEEGNLKVYMILSCKFENVKADGVVAEIKTFQTPSAALLHGTLLDNWYGDAMETLLKKIEEFEDRDSGWTMVEVDHILITMSRYIPLQVGQGTWVPLPRDIQLKRAVVNLQNDDNFCFLWCVNAALHEPVGRPERISAYRHFSLRLNYEGIKFPIVLKDVPKFEQMNNVRINVYGIETEMLKNFQTKSVTVPLYLSNNNLDQPAIHLLMINTDIAPNENVDNVQDYQPIFHFTWIRSLSRLIKSQLSKSTSALYFCDRCLCHFKIEKSFLNHKTDCFSSNDIRMILPDEDNNILRFNKFTNQELVSFIVYADLKCILEQDADNMQTHTPHSAAFFQKCSFNDNLSKFKLNRSPECIEWFLRELKALAEDVNYYLEHAVVMDPLTHDEQRRQNVGNCHICRKPFGRKEKRIRDHCHFTGKYRGPAHNLCNLLFRRSHIIPVVLHNFFGYDSHF